MSRRYADPVDVQRAVQDGQATPTSFLWRGRLYVVREVLGHWWERRPWWTTAAGRAVHGESELLVTEGSADADLGADLGADREVWRVEASRGRSFGSGVYDLCTAGAGPGDPGGSDHGWHLIRVVD
jgi:hypothetical protein